MNKENLDCIKYKFQDKNSEFIVWSMNTLDNDKSINNIKIRYQSITKRYWTINTELCERHLYISLLLIGPDEIENEYLVIGITWAEIDKAIF